MTARAVPSLQRTWGRATLLRGPPSVAAPLRVTQSHIPAPGIALLRSYLSTKEGRWPKWGQVFPCCCTLPQLLPVTLAIPPPPQHPPSTFGNGKPNMIIFNQRIGYIPPGCSRQKGETEVSPFHDFSLVELPFGFSHPRDTLNRHYVQAIKLLRHPH